MGCAFDILHESALRLFFWVKFYPIDFGPIDLKSVWLLYDEREVVGYCPRGFSSAFYWRLFKVPLSISFPLILLAGLAASSGLQVSSLKGWRESA